MNLGLSLFKLLQLASPALPVGAYSYSEGLEALVEQKVIDKKDDLCIWIERELRCGSIRIEAAMMARGYRSFEWGDRAKLEFWNGWLSASRETEELRQQSWQMGQSLLKLLLNLSPPDLAIANLSPCNYAIAFGIAAAQWQIAIDTAVMAYLHSWAANLTSAGVKLIPLGQTEGQQILYSLAPQLAAVTQELLNLEDEALESCSWGLSLASAAHEIQYTRLFRS